MPHFIRPLFVLLSLCWLTFAHAVPSLQSQNTGGFILDIPYLEFGSGMDKKAFSARLATENLNNFSLLLAQNSDLQPNASQIPQVSSIPAGFRLSIPYLEFINNGITRAYKADLTTTDLANFELDMNTVAEIALDSTVTSPPLNVTVDNANTQTVGGLNFASSSQLQVAWTAPVSGNVHHYQISASEAVMDTQVIAETTQTSITLGDLKAGTAYNITVAACADASCAKPTLATPQTATTSEEYWQLQGSGNATSGLTKIPTNGNARISATRFGSGADTNTDRIQLYYGASQREPAKPVSGISVATTSATTDATNLSSYLSFTSLAGSSGVTGEANAATGTVTSILRVATGQAVPLSEAMGGKVRLFFEARDSNNKTRIWYIDSKDGYIGRDFNSGIVTTCELIADFATGGGCEPTLAVGIDSDSVNGNTKIDNARQFKIGWPTLNDWRWDGAVGTFMVFTTDQVSGCSTYGMNHGYAVWDGTQWNVQYKEDGCPQLFKSAQAMFPMHVGGLRYKAYYGDPSVSAGRISTSHLPFLGPKKLIYADGSTHVEADVVDFDDWEATNTARNVNFLWPDGSKLNDQAEGYIDDYHFLAPTGSLDLQVMYLAITDGSVMPFSAAAILLNP